MKGGTYAPEAKPGAPGVLQHMAVTADLTRPMPSSGGPRERQRYLGSRRTLSGEYPVSGEYPSESVDYLVRP